MNFIVECMRILVTIIVVCFCSIIIHISLSLWEMFPIKEERSTPIYITKEIYNDK